MPGVAVYLTMNARPSSWLPSAIARRFERREYPRAGRSQMEAVARLYARNEARALERLGLGPDEFAAALVANLWSDERVVAVGHFHSGRALAVRARDLQTASPGKVRELIETFASDVAAGEATSLEQLYLMLDREFRAAELTVRNIRELTFLKQPHDDTLRTLEHAG